MLYIHQTTCISPQQTFSPASSDLRNAQQHKSTGADLSRATIPGIDLVHEHHSVNNTLKVIEPSYDDIPANALRRMTKSVRMGVSAALPLIQQAATAYEPPSASSDPSSVSESVAATALDGIIIGTASTGMEESIQFMKQIIGYEEGPLSPGAFVQSTPNTVASQISFLSRNKAYNITHVHSGLAFENALTDAGMLLKENPQRHYLLGGVDEIGTYNYNIDYLNGWYKKEPLSSAHLYEADSPGSLAGEGAAMFLVSNQPANALAKVRALTTLHSEDPSLVDAQLRHFLDSQLPAGEKIDLLLTGENGDNRLLPYFRSCEAICEAAFKATSEAAPRAVDNAGSGTGGATFPDNGLTIARFKHLCGEYPTASAFALWLACQVLGNQSIPAHMIKRQSAKTDPVYKNVLICNTYKGIQHSIMLVSKINQHPKQPTP